MVLSAYLFVYVCCSLIPNAILGTVQTDDLHQLDKQAAKATDGHDSIDFNKIQLRADFS